MMPPLYTSYTLGFVLLILLFIEIILNFLIVLATRWGHSAWRNNNKKLQAVADGCFFIAITIFFIAGVGVVVILPEWIYMLRHPELNV